MTTDPESTPVPPFPREGIFLPDFDKVSKEWKAVVEALATRLEAQSAAWQGELRHLVAVLEAVLAELQSLRGLTVSLDRAPAAPEAPPT